MDWQHKSRLRQIETLRYFDKYDYPLTKKEILFWTSPITHPSIPSLKLREGKTRGELFFLSGREKIIKLRTQREKYSLLKWGKAYQYASQLVKIPFVLAIFVTGSLAMNNCKKNDDIDFMVITDPNTLWIVRFLANIMFIKNRRYPHQKNASDKICINLWLDSRNLKVESRSLYHAHEILQAKCIFDHGGIQYNFLKQNSWVKEYLPNAYKRTFENLKIKNLKLIENCKLKIVNYILFVLQYLYMKSKMTTERVGLGFAFFHPNSS